MGDSSNTFVIVEVFFIPFYISEIDFFLSGDFLKLKKNINSFKIIYQKSHLRMSSLAFFLYFTFCNETNALALVHLCFNIFRNRKLRIIWIREITRRTRRIIIRLRRRIRIFIRRTITLRRMISTRIIRRIIIRRRRRTRKGVLVTWAYWILQSLASWRERTGLALWARNLEGLCGSCPQPGQVG